MRDTYQAAAYGGAGWSPRQTPMRQEIGSIWGGCGVDTEWGKLLSVLLHYPGPELLAIADPNLSQQLSLVDVDLAREQHQAMSSAFQRAGVKVHLVEPGGVVPPNLMFVADLMFMTPEGAIVGRPASTVRAGEERFIARRLADLGIPILRTIRGTGTFEGADAMWISPRAVLLATGLRTNGEGAEQVMQLLQEMGIDVVQVGLAYGTMHLMGELRILDRDLAVAWPRRAPHAAVAGLRERGFRVMFLPDEREAIDGMALNFVVLGPREVLMPAGNPITQATYEAAGVTCHTIDIAELAKAAGGIGCMTGILERKRQ